ncbi:MAG TPA: tetratricopeptide repeat protein [Candidatus Polarisedimenticolia bacterium]|nr:tetratricopeptide repeat protein [Candidatus Polarisedimenticolia bacterium]
MPLDRAKTMLSAEKFVRAGKIPEAIAEFRKLADDNPRDMNIFNKLGDLCVRAGKSQDAIRYFLRIAEFYASDGFFLKAIAMYKKVSKLDPANMDCLQKLASLYLKQGLTIEAKAQYLEVTDHYIKAAQFKKALEVLPQVLQIEPDNIKIRMSYADLLGRTGGLKEAAREFAQVARDLSGKGMVDEAIKVGQKGLKVAPGDPDLMSLMLSLSKEGRKNPDELLAAVVSMAKNNGDNPRSLALLGEAYLTAGKTKDAEKVFKKLAALGEGAPAEAAGALGRYFVSKDDDEPALEWMSRAAGQLVEASRAGEAAGLLDEFLRAFPDHRGGLAKRAEVAERAGDAKSRVAALQRLARSFIAANEIGPARDVVLKLREIDPENPRHIEALKSLDARTGATDAGGPAVAAQQEADSPEEPGADLAGDIDLEQGISLEPEPVLEGDSGEEPASEGIEHAAREIGGEDSDYGPVSMIQDMQAESDDEEEDEEFISEHFTEAEVFIKYGLLEKAKQQLLGILAKHPKHLPSHTKLKEIYYEEGNKDKAVEESIALAEILKARGRSEEARELVNEAVRLDPNNPRVKTYTGGAAGSVAEPKAAAAAAKPPTTARPAKPQPPVATSATRPQVGKPAAAPAPRELTIEEPVAETPRIEVEASGGASDGLIEIEVPEEPPSAPRPRVSAKPAPPPAKPAGPVRPVPERVEEETPEDLMAGLSLGEDEDEITIEIDEGGAQEPPGAPAPPPASARGRAPVETDPDAEKLGEVDFYVDQGLLEEARAVLFQLQKQYPQSEEVAKRFERANRPAPEKPAPPAPPQESDGLDLDVERAFGTQKLSVPRTVVADAPRARKARPVFRVETAPAEAEGDFFDLASELDKSLAEAQVAVDTQEQASLDEPGHTLDEIFRAFKKGVEQQVDSHDYDTHYNLGIAYKEMGLVDEAIGEFQFAAKDPARTVECCGILGLCFREKGMPELALKWYKKGLDTPDLAERESIGLRYDVAEVHREQGDYQKALQLYTEVYGMDSTYRDVTAKLKEMRKLLG